MRSEQLNEISAGELEIDQLTAQHTAAMARMAKVTEGAREALATSQLAEQDLRCNYNKRLSQAKARIHDAKQKLLETEPIELRDFLTACAIGGLNARNGANRHNVRSKQSDIARFRGARMEGEALRLTAGDDLLSKIQDIRTRYKIPEAQAVSPK